MFFRRRLSTDREPHGVRMVAEAFVCLAIAVVLVREFLVEGYMISTGSMAPTLLGYHQRVVCPSCSHVFAHGTAFDDDAAGISTGAPPRVPPDRMSCPHCGQTGIDLTAVPVTNGDQLLVNKAAFQVRNPERWELAVFRNPTDLDQAYVKRIAGLPGESVRIREGDLWIDGERVRKPLTRQRGMRLLVFAQHNDPDPTRDWQPRWIGRHDDPETITGWHPVDSGFVHNSTDEVEPKWDWLRYRHRIRSGGTHVTTVPLKHRPDNTRFAELVPIESADPSRIDDWSRTPVRYDTKRKRLVCRGVLSEEWRDRLLAAGDRTADEGTPKSEAYEKAIWLLAERSHLSPIFDHYGYNSSRPLDRPIPVRDLMLSFRLGAMTDGDGESNDRPMQMAIGLEDGHERYLVVLDFRRRVAVLTTESKRTPLRTARFPTALGRDSVTVELSTFDRQVVFAIDGRSLFEPWPIPSRSGHDSIEPPREPARIGARGVSVPVTDLRLYRDVYYTRGRAKHAIDSAITLGPHEYFMLGDNSPVSSDSRSWDQGAVPRGMLLGRPFLVHLPSSPGKLRIGPWTSRFRLPDFGRIRFLR